MNSPKPIIYLDASAFKESGCLRRLQYVIHDGLREKSTDMALIYGSAFHKFRATLRTTGETDKSLSEAIEFYNQSTKDIVIPDSEWRTLGHLLGTCSGYAQKVYNGDIFRPLKDKNDKFFIEQKFSFTYYEDDFCEIHLCGTIDELGVLENDQIALCDCKTSSSFYKKESYLQNYSLSSQLMWYKMVAEQCLGLTNIGAFIDGVFLDKVRPSAFCRSELFFYSTQQMDSLKRQIDRLCLDISDSVRHGNSWEMNYTQCDCAKFNSDKADQCRFFPLCSQADESTKEMIINSKYTKKQYNPMLFGELDSL